MVRRVLLAASVILVACGADARNPAPVAPTQSSIAPTRFDSNLAWMHLEKQVAFGARPSGSPALAQCRQYIEDQLKALNIQFREQPFDAMTPAGVIKMVNVI